MDRFVNIKMMAHPLNWITLLIWLTFLGVVIYMVDPYLPTPHPKTAKG